MAEIYENAANERMIICAVREAHIRPFQATDWLDLRVGFFLSLTASGNDDDPSGLAEVIGTPPRPLLSPSDRVAIGIIDKATQNVFCGYSNTPPGRIEPSSVGTSDLVSSDVGIGTSNTFYWRPKNEISNNYSVIIADNGQTRATAGDGSQPHFIQSDPGGGEYCTFLGLRFTRPDARGRARIITMEVKKTVGGHSSDLLFTDDPSNEVGDAALEAWPSDVQTLGPVELSQVPDTLFFYWPFHNSRLRIHEVCILKAG